MRSTTTASVWSAARAAMALAILAAVIAQLARSVGTGAELGRDVGVTIANFFSFFTVLSNTAAAVVLVWAAVRMWTTGRRADAEPAGLATALACVSTCMIITGIVYNLLLRGIALPQGSEPIPWSNEILHLVGPLFLLADVLFAPLRRALPWRALWAILAFPIVWVVYTMIRGPLVTNPVTGDSHWYPYPFLDPNLAGWGSVVLYVIGIALAIVAVGAFVVWWGRRRGLPRAAESTHAHERAGSASARN